MSEVKWDKFESIAIEYRREMTMYLEKTISLANERVLSPQDADNFKNDTRTAGYARKFLSHEISLLITKAHIHLLTVRYANKKNNLHSLAIHLRVVLECAGQIVRKFNNFSNKNPNEFFIRVSEYQTIMHNMTGRIPNIKDKKTHLSFVRNTAEDHRAGLASDLKVKIPKIRWRSSEAVNHLEFGNGWYDHISRYFFHSGIEDLKSTSYTGGVLSNNRPFDTYMFAFFLDYLVHQSLVMVLAAETLEPDDCLFQKSAELIKEKKERSSYYKKELDKCKVK